MKENRLREKRRPQIPARLHGVNRLITSCTSEVTPGTKIAEEFCASISRSGRLGSLAPNLIMVGPALGPEIPGVQFLQEVTDSMLTDLYRNAALLLFPSLYEGFGWPVVEANACGCPAVVSEIAPLIEAGGAAPVLISDPRDIQNAADRVIEVLGGDSLTR